MLKINRDVNFDPVVGSIVYTSMNGYFDLRHELDDVIFIIKDDQNIIYDKFKLRLMDVST